MFYWPLVATRTLQTRTRTSFLGCIFIKLSGFLGTAFGPVKADINGNVVKVRTRFEKDPEGQKYLQVSLMQIFSLVYWRFSLLDDNIDG